MSRYDGLIIPRSYSEYINKTDAATLSQALALPGVMDAAPTENSNKAARSGGIYSAINNCFKFPDYANRITPSGLTWIATEDCYITILQVFSYASTAEVYVDGNVVSVTDSQTDLKILSFNGYVKKGQRVYYDYLTNSKLCKIFPLI